MKLVQQLQELFDKELGNIYDSQENLSRATFELMIALGWLSTVTLVAETSFVLTTKGLEFYQNKIQKELDIAGWVEIVFTLTYLESFEALVQTNKWLRIKINKMVSYQELFEKYGYLKYYPDISNKTNELREQTQQKVSQWQNEIKYAVNQLEQLEFNHELIQKTLTNFIESPLGRALNNILSIYLEQTKLNTHTISIITGWVAWETQKHVELILSHENDEFVARVKAYTAATQDIKTNQKFHSIELYLAEHISTSPSNQLQVFDKVTIPDIYVPLKCHLLNSNGKKKEHEQLVDLETWGFKQLTDSNKNNQVMFIQAESGRGKTVFCKMFANWVREHLHPIWTPILVRLHDIDTFEVDIENTLRTVIKEDFAQNNDWLTDCNTRFIFILDGFDELRLEGRNSGTIEKFLKQVGNYQIKCQTSSNLGHRFLVTGRFAALHSIELMPSNLERVEIALMDNQLQEQWLKKWGNLVGIDKAEAFQSFLEAECPEHVLKLAQEPLLLHLLAAMHRDRKLTAKTFEGLDSVRSKILIYQSILNSVLIQRSENHNFSTSKFNISDLRHILTEAGLCVIQSGKGWAPIKMIEERLRSNTKIKKILGTQSHLGENLLNNAFTVFSSQPASNSHKNEEYIEFVHKSFGEFLCALLLAESFRKWTQTNLDDSDEQPLVNDNQLAKEIYDLLYYSGLTPEIVEYVIALLDYDYNQIKLVDTLFKRLENFYTYWCKGKFINAYPQNFPQNRILRTKALVFSGLREIDIYTGLNVMILLLELYRYAQTQDALKNKIIFYPCGQKDSENFEDDLFFCIISYSNSLNLYTFLDTVGYFLGNVQLSGAKLSSVNLSSVKLNNANLSAVNFSDAKLRFADLSGADLSNTDLSDANLSHANLSSANLNGANLNNANLSNANLSNVDLSNATLHHANLSDANLSNANLSNANLSNANLNHAKLTYTDLRSANLHEASCYEVNFSGATLCSATLNHARLKGANCNRTDFSKADLTSANFINAQNLTVQQVRVANNWDKVEYNPEFSLLVFNSDELIE
ncbi:pentapeptide repeat-containing protein [Calothrix sp. NIES-4071]|nr:pentapeptide repeat-containing protein [Calothrix sp. NIES-4071]BAZ56934.1 pentapeptide repeat-containing protein [Calothrix sp. NIES-4105]